MMQSALNNEPVQWPNITNVPINEFYTLAGISNTIPIWYIGDPTCSNRYHPV